MVKVLKTNNNYYVAFSDDVTLSAAEIRQYKTADYNDPKIPNHYLFKEQFPKANCSLTRLLMTEINNTYRKQAKLLTNWLTIVNLSCVYKKHLKEPAAYPIMLIIHLVQMIYRQIMPQAVYQYVVKKNIILQNMTATKSVISAAMNMV